MQNLTGSPSFHLDSAGVVVVGQADMFGHRVVLTGDYSSVALDLSSATMESGEPNTTSATKTLWYEFVILGDAPLKLHAKVSGGVGTVALNVFKCLTANVDDDIDPTFAMLTSVVTGTDVVWNTEVDADSYYIQVGLVSGAGTGWTLETWNADPVDGNTFAARIPVLGEVDNDRVDILNGFAEGSTPVPAGITPIRYSWFDWTCPTPTPGEMTFSLESEQTSGSFALTAYTGSSLGSLSSVASNVAAYGNPAQILFTPTAGVSYKIQAATTSDRGDFELSWRGPANQQAPADIYAYIRTEVYAYDGVTKITELPRRKGLQLQELLNEPGSGQISISMTDEILSLYPTLLDKGNIVKFFMGSKCVSGFLIKQTNTVLVDTGEYASWVKTVSGPTVHFLLSDFMVRHDYQPPRPNSPSTRYYSWASPPSAWYSNSDWTDHYNTNTLLDPPGGKPGTLAKDRPKYGYPKNWKDPKAQWMWISNRPSLNEGGYTPPRPMGGRHHYRRMLKITKNGTPVRLYATADSIFKVYLNGELVLSKRGTETGYKSFITFDTVLSKGLHTIGLYMESIGTANKGDLNEAILFSLARLNSKGQPVEFLCRSDKTWRAYHGANPPTWNRAYVLMNARNESSDRNVRSATVLGVGFSGTTDSNGDPWNDRYTQEIQIGTSILDLQNQLSEGGGFDVSVDPGSMTIKAYRRKGKNKSKSVALVPGTNLLNWNVEVTDQIKNDILVQYEGGWFNIASAASIRKWGRREAYVQLGGIKDSQVAKNLMKKVLAGIDSAITRSGASDITTKRQRDDTGGMIGVEGAYPFLDFEVGDTISAPNENGILTPHRVVGLTATEAEDGLLTFDPELVEL